MQKSKFDHNILNIDAGQQKNRISGQSVGVGVSENQTGKPNKNQTKTEYKKAPASIMLYYKQYDPDILIPYKTKTKFSDSPAWEAFPQTLKFSCFTYALLKRHRRNVIICIELAHYREDDNEKPVYSFFILKSE